jgi:low affinity Fe/Cu permease
MNGFRFSHIARRIALLSGRPSVFMLALAVVVLWGVSGPLFGFSDTWQLVINTSTTIVTFLMVFLIQRTQNKDSLAIQLKLNELVAALEGASNRLVSVEDLSESELAALRAFYERLAARAKESADLTRSHSIDEAERRHHHKLGAQGRGKR